MDSMKDQMRPGTIIKLIDANFFKKSKFSLIHGIIRDKKNIPCKVKSRKK